MQYAGTREDDLHSGSDPYTIPLSRTRPDSSSPTSFELLLEPGSMLDLPVNMRRVDEGVFGLIDPTCSRYETAYMFLSFVH
jgi:hypothetical protein